MKLTGRVDRVLPEQSGVSKNGNTWRKRTVILTYDASNPKYPKSVVFDVVGDKIERYNFEVGADYEIDVDFEVREWNGRYFQQVGVFGAVRIGAQMPQQPYPQQPPQQYAPQQYTQQPQPQQQHPTAQPYQQPPQQAQPFGGQVFPQNPQPQQQTDDLPF